MKTLTLSRISLRVLLAWCVLSVAGLVWVRPIVGAFTPLMESTIDAMQSGYRSHLALIGAQGVARLVMSCAAEQPRFLPDGQFIPQDVSVECAYTDAVHALVPVVIFLVAVVGWPASGWAEAGRRTIAALLGVPCVVMLTTPVVLVGLESMGRNPGLFDGSRGQVAALMQPFALMELGGRWLLPLALAVFCIRIARRGPRSQIIHNSAASM